MSALKILFVVDGLWVGGTERSLAEMLPYLVQADITPVIACFNRYQQEGVETEVLRQGFDVRFLSGTGLISQVQALRRLIKTERPDIIHTALFKANLVGRLAAVGLPVVVMNSLVNTPYEPIRFQDPNIKASRLRTVQFIDAWTSRYLTAHFHAVSNAAKLAAVNSLGIPPERITVVERGRDPIRLGQPGLERRRQARLKLELQPEDEVIVNVGRHEYQKGQSFLLEAMGTLIHTRPRLVLLVAGRSGHASSELIRLRDRIGLNRRIHFLGHRDDVPNILAAADLFVFPSLFEGLPGAVIEAMALGLPIVAAKIMPVQEVVKEGRNALLVEPTSSSELAIAIETLIKDRERITTFGQCSRAIFEARFTLKRSVSRMIELYREVVDTKQ